MTLVMSQYDGSVTNDTRQTDVLTRIYERRRTDTQTCSSLTVRLKPATDGLKHAVCVFERFFETEHVKCTLRQAIST